MKERSDTTTAVTGMGEMPGGSTKRELLFNASFAKFAFGGVKSRSSVTYESCT